MKMHLIKVTKEIAKSYLEVMHQSQSNPRKMQRSRVDRLKADMNTKQFYLTHQGISFDANGRLTDGQHRLQAFIESDLDEFVTWAAFYSVDSDECQAQRRVDIPLVRQSYIVAQEKKKRTQMATFLIKKIRRFVTINDIEFILYKTDFGSDLCTAADMIDGTHKRAIGGNVFGVAVALNLYQKSSSQSYLEAQISALVSQRYDEMTPAIQSLNRIIVNQNKKQRSINQYLELATFRELLNQNNSHMQTIRMTENKVEAFHGYFRSILDRISEGPFVGVSASRRTKERFLWVVKERDEEVELGEEAFLTFEEAVQKVRENMEEEAKVTLIWTVNEEENIKGEKHLCILGPLRGRLANNCEGVKSGLVVEVNNGDEYVIGEDAFLTIQDVAAHITDKATLHEKK